MYCTTSDESVYAAIAAIIIVGAWMSHSAIVPERVEDHERAEDALALVAHRHVEIGDAVGAVEPEDVEHRPDRGEEGREEEQPPKVGGRAWRVACARMTKSASAVRNGLKIVERIRARSVSTRRRRLRDRGEARQRSDRHRLLCAAGRGGAPCPAARRHSVAYGEGPSSKEPVWSSNASNPRPTSRRCRARRSTCWRAKSATCWS